MHAPLRLGLTSAVVLLAACGPAKPTFEAGEAGDESEADGSEGDTQPGESSEGDTGTPEPACTFENFANDPQLQHFTEVGCFPAVPGESCPVCELSCMESIVFDCPIDGCGLPDFPCINACGNHLVLCSEKLGDQCCYLVTAEYVGGIPGRPLRERGVPRLPTLTVMISGFGDAHHRKAADAYREFARYEHASVASFLHTAAILEQLEAPIELIERHREAAREEAGHARMALAAAQALDGRMATLGGLPVPAIAFEFESFVRDLIHDGCIGELIATREAEWALEQPCVHEREPLLRYWTTVRSEEAGHAALAWAVLEWLLDVRPVLRPLITRELAAATRPPAPVLAREDDTLGVATSHTKATLRERALAELIASARALVEGPLRCPMQPR
jgi:hypothetical protein